MMWTLLYSYRAGSYGVEDAVCYAEATALYDCATGNHELMPCLGNAGFCFLVLAFRSAAHSSL